MQILYEEVRFAAVDIQHNARRILDEVRHAAQPAAPTECLASSTILPPA
jgi:hypothetical protein